MSGSSSKIPRMSSPGFRESGTLLSRTHAGLVSPVRGCVTLWWVLSSGLSGFSDGCPDHTQTEQGPVSGILSCGIPVDVLRKNVLYAHFVFKKMSEPY